MPPRRDACRSLITRWRKLVYAPVFMQRSHIDWLHRHAHDERRVRRGHWFVAASLLAMLVGASTDFTQAGAAADGAAGAESNPTVDVIAAQYSVEPDLVSARLRHAQAVRSVVADWESSYPDTFAGSFHADGFAASTTVRFVGSVPASVQAQAANLESLASVGKIVFDTTATRTKRELRSSYLRAVSLLEDAGIQEAETTYSLRSQNIEVTLRVDDDVSLPPEYATSDAVKSMLESNGVGSVTLKAITGRLVHTESGVYGGDKVRDVSEGSDCTSAFAVTDGSTDGILTAAHCEDRDLYVAVNGDGGTFSMSYQEGHKGAQGDMAWYSTTGAEGPWIYRNPSTEDDVSGYLRRNWIREDDYFCFYGIATDAQKCGQVVKEEVSATSGGVTVGNLVAMDGPNLTSVDGDSGGPWYEGAYESITAVGIHYGAATNGYRLFTPVQSALTRFDLEILVHD